jgi:hypothetical protein
MTTAPALHAALRACADGLLPVEAGVELLINHGSFLHRSDFRDRFVDKDTSITDGVTPVAEIDWTAAMAALRAGDLPCSGGEQRVLRLAASLADGIPVDLRDTVTGLDDRNIELMMNAILHASGRRSAPPENIHDHF